MSTISKSRPFAFSSYTSTFASTAAAFSSRSSFKYALLGLSVFSSVPGAAAETVCYSNYVNGPLICRNRLPLKARIALGVTACAILFLVITLMLCVSRNRSSARAAAAATEYNVEAAQMQGPPALIATHYNPTSGPAGVYRTSAGVYATSAGVQASNPGTVPGVAYPARAQVYSHYGSQPQTDAYYSQLYGQPTQPRTAPASKVSFQQGEQAYSFGGYEPGMAPAPPRTAYVSSGFPRPLYTGTGKDKDEEELRVLQEVNGGR